MTLPRYATREDVKAALDVATTARADAQIDRLLDGASRAIEGLTHRRFYPELAVRYFDWPDGQMGRSWRLWLGKNELVSASIVSSGGVTIDSGDYLLRPDTGPPYSRIEIDLSGPAAFGGGSTHQRDVTVTGTFGYRDDAAAAGVLAEALDASGTTVDITDSAAIGVGDLIRVDNERMLVIGKRMLTTGQTLQTALAANTAGTTVAVSDGTTFAVGEAILLDAERMSIVDVAGNNLIVKRNWDGSTLGAHAGSTIYAPRTLVVERGVLGTTAVTHDTAAAITRHVVPGPVNELCIAEALVGLGREQSGYARTVGSGDGVRPAPGGDIRDLRAQVKARYGRVRKGAI